MERPASTLYASSLNLYEAAREAGEFAVAYHALAAALHAAESLADPAACTRVEGYANECRAWIDANRPTHALATSSAQSRGHESIFKQLAVMASAARLRMLADEQKKKGRPKAPFAGTEG